MGKTATGTMKWEPWQPQPYAVQDSGPVLSRGTVVNHYTGDLVATGALECLVLTEADGTSPFQGLERVTGSLDGRQGSFVFRLDGVVRPGTAEATLTVVPGSGTGDLKGLRGEARYTSGNVGPDGHAEFTFEYELD
ncbi:DUF3224 domain-containing protein [Microbispora hainanensis]|jgi:hypothetical protein|uniref:DUF3224 domain-containing protein n=1 Tax=Microbispora hainanensis TaxID=568844 RepID=A0ABZ1SXT2_9ACTN|nr:MULTISPECIES: DUF3224 domain-containing protein [Microbispora]NJP26431.1 DUF3224 domain-containing protein [Microbispora sp. CL1-1]